MSHKNTIKCCITPKLTLHLYYCHINGYQLATRVGNMKECYVQDLTESEANKIEEQLNE